MRTIISALAITMVMAAATAAHAADWTNAWVQVSWTFATENVDGSPLTDLAGAKVYYGTASSNYTKIVDFPGGSPGETKTVTVSGLKPGTRYYFNGTAYNAAGLESDFCNEVAKTTPAKPGKLKTFLSGSSGVAK